MIHINEFTDYKLLKLLENYESDNISYDEFNSKFYIMINESNTFNKIEKFINTVVNNIKKYVSKSINSISFDKIKTKITNILNTINKNLKRLVPSMSKVFLVIIMLSIFQPMYAATGNKDKISEIIDYQIELADNTGNKSMSNDLNHIKNSGDIKNNVIEYNEKLYGDLTDNKTYDKIKNLDIKYSTNKEDIIKFMVSVDDDVILTVMGKLIRKGAETATEKRAIAFLKDLYKGNVKSTLYNVSQASAFMALEALIDVQNEVNKNGKTVSCVIISALQSSARSVVDK